MKRGQRNLYYALIAINKPVEFDVYIRSLKCKMIFDVVSLT